jgi:hypothetical protein
MFVLLAKKTDISVAPDSDGGFIFDNCIDLGLPEDPFLSVGQMAKK